jgi:hypothetical protein
MAQLAKLQLLSDTAYMCRPESIATVVDRIRFTKKGAMDQARYFVSAGNCSCLSFGKTGKCKHLNIVNGVHSDSAAMSDVAVEVERVIAVLKDKLGENVSPPALPLLERVSVVEITVPKFSGSICFIPAVKSGSFLIRIRQQNNEKIEVKDEKTSDQ